MSLSRLEHHTTIAKRHKKFIAFLCDCAQIGEPKCDPAIFCPWIVVAAYHRATHLIESIFAKHNRPEVPDGGRNISYNHRRNGLGRLNMPMLQREYGTLYKLSMYIEIFPAQSPMEYDVITRFDLTLNNIVNGVLKNIEDIVTKELNDSTI